MAKQTLILAALYSFVLAVQAQDISLDVLRKAQQTERDLHCSEFIPPPAACTSAHGHFILNVTNYFGCGKEHLTQIDPCIVDDPAALLGTDAVLDWTPDNRSTVFVNEQPSLPAPVARTLYQLRNAVVDGRYGAVYNPSLYISGIWYLSNPQEHNSVALRGGSGWVGMRPGTNWKQVAPRARKLVNLIIPWGFGFQHVLCDALQRIDAVHAMITDDPDTAVLIRPGDGNTTFEKLFPKEYNEGRFVFARDDTVYPADVVYFPFFALSEYHNFTQHEHLSFCPSVYKGSVWARNKLRVQAPPEQRNIVTYVGRTQGRSRCVLNEVELIAQLRPLIEQLGFSLRVLIDPHDRGGQLTTLLSKTVLLFGAHGGVFSEMFLLPDRAHVLEFNKDLNDVHPDSIGYNVRNLYANQAHGLGVSYWRFVPEEFQENYFGGTGFIVNVTKLVPFMLRLFSSLCEDYPCGKPFLVS